MEKYCWLNLDTCAKRLVSENSKQMHVIDVKSLCDSFVRSGVDFRENIGLRVSQ